MPLPASPLKSSSGEPANNSSTAPQQKPQEASGATEKEAPSPKSHAPDSFSVVRLLSREHAAEVIDKLDLEDLKVLNKCIVSRMKMLYMSKNEQELSRFYPGNKVRFTSKNGGIKTGVVIRVNQKTVSVVIDGEEGWWKVSPQMLHHL